MPIRTKIKDIDSGLTVDMDLESDTTVNDIIESAATFWTKKQGAFVLKWGNIILRGDAPISEAEIKDGDTLELISDPQGG
jgi:hypothetical protein